MDRGHLFFIVVIVALLISAGCITGNQSGTASPTSTQLSTPSAVSTEPTPMSTPNELNSQQNGNPYEKNATIALELLHCYHGDDSYSYDDCVTIATRDLPELGAPVSDVSMVMKDWCKIRTDPRCSSL